jgi:glycosyltransferase involved in cell wall biosynthesis
MMKRKNNLSENIDIVPDIGIKHIDISGVENPLLFLYGSCEAKEFDFEIYNDNIKCNVNIEHNGRDYKIYSPLDKDKKIVTVYVIIDKKKYLISIIKTSIFHRTIKKALTLLITFLKKIGLFFVLIYKAIKYSWINYHFLIPLKIWPKLIKSFVSKMKGTQFNFYNPQNITEYNKWLNENKSQTEYVILNKRPLMSFIIPVYNIDKNSLSTCLDSILAQTYENFEVCIADDCSNKKETKETLEEYKKKDKRIKIIYRKTNGNISAASNTALKMAKGEYICLVDDDDTLDKDALYENVRVINENSKVDFIYSDEDKINLKGQYCDPNFKSDFAPDSLLSSNYICHFSVIKRNLVELVGGFEIGLEGAQDYDLFLKVTEKSKNIYHIPKILYHWRMVEGSTSMTISNKSYAIEKGKIAIQNALKRRKIKASVSVDPKSYYYIVTYLCSKEPKISIIIPTRDHVDILKKCIESIYSKTTYKNFEIIIADNSSKEKETLSYFENCKKSHSNIKIVKCNMEFNYSKINNTAVRESSGDYIVLLNNDTEIITPEWLSIMVGYAMQKHIGTVGVKLLYPEDETVQHAGVILGLGGVASHAYLYASRDELGLNGRLRVPYNYSANTAACLMVNKKKYFEVDGLNEELKVAYNDIDFNLKLLKKGYYNVFLPQVEVFHYESKSRGLDTTTEKYKRFLEESKYMWNRWEKILNNDHFYNKNYSKKGWFVLDKKSKNIKKGK